MIEFHDRLMTGNSAADECLGLLDRLGIAHALTGQEYWKQTEDFMETIRQRTDYAALKIRFRPDIIAVGECIYNIDFKSGFTTERKAHKVYKQMSFDGEKVGLIINQRLNNKEIYFTDIENVVLKKQKPSKYINFIQPPIEDDVWLCPRKLPKELYYEWKRKTGGSGCEYAHIDFEKSKFINLYDFIEEDKKML